MSEKDVVLSLQDHESEETTFGTLTITVTITTKTPIGWSTVHIPQKQSTRSA